MTVLMPVSEKEFAAKRNESKFAERKDVPFESLDEDLESLKSMYLEELKEDPKRHENNETYEGY